MKLTNAQMFDSIPVLMQAKDEKGLLGYAVAVNLRKLSAEVKEYSGKRDQLLAAHGTEAKDSPGRYSLTPAAAAAFEAELKTFAELETDVQVMQVAPEVFYGGNLTSSQMYTLAWMVKEE